ncbi:MAG TPA: transporter [Saprospiraceae bacterium]|nr:transporter [Saprospiraceae bacterium]HMQ82920.1 transporter [Saprospiraceae bacterium]
MKNQHKIGFILALLSILGSTLMAQTPSDALMMKKKEICIAAMYEHSWFDEYWEGTYLRHNETIATVDRHMVMPMAAIGIVDRLNLIVAAPYVKTASREPNGGKFEGAKGFQDLSLALKGEIFNKEMGKGKLALLGTVSYSTPITNYLSDYRPYSIGFGANELGVRGILQYQLNSGIYIRGALAYLFRGQTKAERDYYYNNGSYYTPWMDVPSAWNYNAVAGIWLFDSSWKIEANYMGLVSTSGDDIRAYNAAQPTNKVDMGVLGVSSQYYFKKLKGLGLLAYYSDTLSGRNVGKSAQYGVGVTYQFKL